MTSLYLIKLISIILDWLLDFVIRKYIHFCPFCITKRSLLRFIVSSSGSVIENWCLLVLHLINKYMQRFDKGLKKLGEELHEKKNV